MTFLTRDMGGSSSFLEVRHVSSDASFVRNTFNKVANILSMYQTTDWKYDVGSLSFHSIYYSLKTCGEENFQR